MRVVLDIKEEKLDIFLTIIKNLKSDIIDGIDFLDNDLDIEPIERDSEDYKELREIKIQNNPKYSLSEAKEILGL